MAMNQIIGVEKSLESSRQEMALCQDYNIRDHYYIISNGYPELTVDSIHYFLTKMGVDLSTKYSVQELINLFDFDSDGKLNLEEFTEMVAPTQREYRILLNCRIDNNEDGNREIHEVIFPF